MTLNVEYSNDIYPLRNQPGCIIEIIKITNDSDCHYQNYINKICLTIRAPGGQGFLAVIDTGEIWHNEDLMKEIIYYRILRFRKE